MNFERLLQQDVTYWSPGTPDGFGGTTFGSPIYLKGRWEERSELITTPDGELLRARTRVFLDRDVVTGGYLYLGRSANASPAMVEGAHEILDFRKIPSLDATTFERRALL